ncbi:MAG: GntR family transcriptional regulator [Tissierellia bacterium]|jgi:GntR family transcriptional regulator|nr:GntR family transcriptional regulator [Tissierellia bacterium]
MEIIISNNRDKPIYEQITEQIKYMVMSGELNSGERIPSIRALAKELKISIITVQRAYEELQRDGFIETEIGRGTFIANPNKDLLLEEKMRLIEILIEEAVDKAKSVGIDLEKLKDIVQIIYMEEE